MEWYSYFSATVRLLLPSGLLFVNTDGNLVEHDISFSGPKGFLIMIIPDSGCVNLSIYVLSFYLCYFCLVFYRLSSEIFCRFTHLDSFVWCHHIALLLHWLQHPKHCTTQFFLARASFLWAQLNIEHCEMKDKARARQALANKQMNEWV